jgi:hypothetical protein
MHPPMRGVRPSHGEPELSRKHGAASPDFGEKNEPGRRTCETMVAIADTPHTATPPARLWLKDAVSCTPPLPHRMGWPGAIISSVHARCAFSTTPYGEATATGCKTGADIGKKKRIDMPAICERRRNQVQQDMISAMPRQLPNPVMG